MSYNVKYVIVEWPYTQELMEHPDFNEHACLINEESWLDQYGWMSYFVEEDWLKLIGKC
jgi:hypothetical protein